MNDNKLLLIIINNNSLMTNTSPLNIRINWNFYLPEYSVIEFNITKLDLGWRGNPLHWEYPKNNEIQNDMLLIGIGEYKLIKIIKIII